MAKLHRFALVALIGVVCAGGAMAQGAHQGHAVAPKPEGPRAATNTNEATRAFEAANAKMHRDMTIRFTGNADRDFVAGMIPHHQGAIDMARVVLQHGSDPELRKLAEEIIDAQNKEIAFMRAWQAKQR